MKKARFIYNPSSGREEAKKNLAMILDYLEGLGYETSSFATKSKNDAKIEASRVCKLGFDLIVVAGGDGTVNEVINGMAENDKKPKLAIIPLGTTNDLATALGISKKIKEALEIIKSNKSKKIDIGRLNNKYFINIAGGGIFTEVAYEAPIKLKTAIGQMAYYIKGIEKLPYFKPFEIEVEWEGNNLKEEVMIFLVTNSNLVGGFEKLSPKAKIDDGLLDVLILKKTNLAQLARVMTLLLNGEHINDPKVIHFQTSHLKIKSKKDIHVNLDGELGCSMPCEIEVLPKHIEVMTNK